MFNESNDAPALLLLSEQHLRHTARHAKNEMPERVDDIATKTLRCTFDCVLFTAAAPGLQITHRVAALNTLCALIDQSSSKSRPALAAHIFDIGIWNRSFTLYLTRSDLMKPKSSRQLLASLTTALVQAPLDPHAKGQIKESAAISLIQGITQSEDDQLAKAAVSCLTQFLNKNVLSLETVLQAFDSGPGGQDGKLKRLLARLLSLVQIGDFVSSICQLITVVLDVHTPLARSRSDTTRPVSLWAEALEMSFVTDTIDIPVMRVHILPTLFKRSFAEYVAFLDRLGIRGKPSTRAAYPHEELLFASLLTGKDIGFVLETDRLAFWSDDTSFYVPLRTINTYLSRASRPARLTGLALLIQSPAATRPLLDSAFPVLKKHLNHLMSDTDSNFRSEVFSLAQHLIDRIKAATAVLTRQAHHSASQRVPIDSQTAADTLRAHQDFLKWLLRDVEWSLRPTATYQRHISALRVLTIIARSGLDQDVDGFNLSKSALREPRWAFHIHVVNPEICQLLLNLLTNPFDDVRQASASLLSLVKNRCSPSDLEKALARAEVSMLATGRADYADGVAHLYTLLYKQHPPVPNTGMATYASDTNMLGKLIQMLETMLEVGRSNLLQAVERYPLHGLLISIRYLIVQDASLANNPDIRKRLCTCLHIVWIVVKPTLSDDAPEGYLPESTEVEQTVSTKDTLSYCWRALKESSSLLGTLITCTSRADSTADTSEFESLALLCFTQLAELRHRGAFSTVAQTWNLCCLQSQALAPLSGRPMLKEWYDRILEILRNKTLINTRRSAGLPSLLCGILVADNTGSMMNHAFTDLETIASEVVDPSLTQEGSLPQVHAMNCLKDVLKNTKLGQESERYIPTSLQLTVYALYSESWAVRNCGLMLFRAVIDRLLGTSETHLEDDLRPTKRVGADQFSDLIGTVLNLLPSPSEQSSDLTPARNEGVFPALQLLQRLHVPDEHYSLALTCSLALIGSPVWHIRDKAARTYTSLVGQDMAATVLQELLTPEASHHNRLHGALLSAKYLIVRERRRLETPPIVVKWSQQKQISISQEILSLIEVESTFGQDSLCAMITAAWIDIIVEAIKLARTCRIYSDDKCNPGESKLYDRLCQIVLEISPTVNESTAVWKLSFARALAMMLTSEANVEKTLDKSTIAAMVSQLSDDAGVEFFQALDIDRLTPLRPHTEGFIRACWTLLEKQEISHSLTCEIIQTMLKFITIASHTDQLLVVELVGSSSCMNLPHQWDTPLLADLLLQLQAASLERGIPAEIVKSRSLHDWINECSAAVNGTGMCSSEAAALSLVHLDHLWVVLSEAEEHATLFRKLILTVATLLNDDDEDVRLLASRTARRISICVSHTDAEMLVPAIASASLVKMLVLTWPTAHDVIESAFARAFSFSSGTTINVSERLADPNDECTALFAEEKQNLYIDEASEVRVWTHAVLGLAPDYIPRFLVRQLSCWVTEGLATLKEQALSQPDGPLSWTSKPDVFTLGLQLIYGAEALLQFANCHVRLHVRPSILRRQLLEIIEVCQKRTDCGLWLREMDRVIAASINQNLSQVKQLLNRLEVTTD